VNILQKLRTWLERVTAPPTPPSRPNILTDASVKRTFHLFGDDYTSSSGYTGEWRQLPSGVIEAFVRIFDSSGGWELNPPYIQFYATPWPRDTQCVVGLAGYDIGTFTLARGKIRPSETSSATLGDDGSVTFTYVNLEFTADEHHRDLPLAVASITITPTGELVVIETEA
jgi:hypothetical protein